MTKASTPLSFLVYVRPLAATAGEWPPLALSLRDLGHNVEVLEGDGLVDLTSYDVVLLWNNPSWFPLVRQQLKVAADSKRPVIATFHAEPLPPPKASGLPRWSVPNRVEVRRMLRREMGAGDMYTNAIRLRRMVREGWLDLIFATSLEKVEYLEEQRIRSWYVPYGYHPSFGTVLGLERTIDVLFLGDQGPFRRRLLLRHLRRQGIPVYTRGNHTEPPSSEVNPEAGC